MITLDPRVYGDPVQQPSDAPTGEVGAGTGVGQAGTTPVERVPSLAGVEMSQPFSIGQAEREAADRERAGVWAGIGAGMLSTDTFAAIRSFTDPSFKPDPVKPNVVELRSTLDFVPDPDSSKWLDASESVEEWNFRVSRLRERAQWQQAGGDSPWAYAFGSLTGDAAYLLTGVGSMQAARLFGKGAGVAAGASGAAAINLAVMQSQPRSAAEIVFSSAFELAAPLLATKVVGRTAQQVPDPDFPAEVLEATLPAGKGKPQYKLKDGVWTQTGGATAKPHIKLKTEAPLTKAALTNPDVGLDSPLKRPYTRLQEAAQDLAQNASQPYIRQVMRLLAPYVPDGAIRNIDEATDPRVRAAFGPNTRAMAVADVDSTDVYVHSGKQVGEETLAHELLHTATMRKLESNAELRESFRSLITRVRMSLSTDQGTWPINDPVRNAEQEFFKNVFGRSTPDVDEFLAYAMTSPTFQRMLDQMDSTGAWLGKVDLPDAPKPLTAFQKIAEWIANLFGGTTKVAKSFEQAMRAREAAQPKTLRTELQERLADMLEEVDPALNPTHHTPEEVFKAVNNVVKVQADSWGKRIGQKVSWNTHKTFTKYGEAGKKIADLLVDDNMDLSKNSVESVHRAVRADLTQTIRGYEDKLRAVMAQEGFGLRQQIFQSRDAMLKQQEIHNAVQMEMFRREQLFRQGKPITYDNVPPHVKELADSLDKVYKQAEVELKAAGVEGAEAIQHYLGFHNRRWSAGSITTMTDKYEALGLTAKEAHERVVKLLARSMRRANNWDERLAYNVAASTIDRALRKGLHEDAPFVTGGNELAAQVRDSLQRVGVTGQDAQAVLDVVVGKQDEVGKAGFLKHRIDMDYTVADVVNGELVRVTDLIDNNLTDIVNRYADGVATQVAFARKGLTKASDITRLREELMQETKRDPELQREARDVFDGVIAKMQGAPVGTDMGRTLRNMQVFTRLVALPWSGLWQSMEIATPMAKYGALKTLKYAVQRMPGFKQLLDDAARDPNTSQHLTDILTRMSSNNIRLRPFVQRLEDGYEISPNAVLDTVLNHTQQLVPYANALKWMHHYQAGIVGNLITDVVVTAAKGDAKAAAQLAKYGVDDAALKLVRESIEKHGLDVDKWDNAAWDASRPAFAKMMDESVLHQRIGDTPAFALLNPVGKFIFTFRSFTLTAHNKVLAGSMGRDGLAAASLLMLYQFPLAALAVQAQAQLNGKPALEEDELAWRAVGQMGAFGLFTDLSKIISGDMQNFGSPALIAVDRGIKVAGHTANGDVTEAIKDGVGLVPLVALPAKIIGAGLQ